MKEIILTKNKVSLVDDEDFEMVNQFKWGWYNNSRTGYASRHLPLGNGKRTKQSIHRLLMNPKKREEVDHINGDGLDNRRSNLRVCTRAENACNRIQVQKNNTSGYRGVKWASDRNKWCVQIGTKGKKISIGYFKDKIQAALAYNQAALKYHGKHANINVIC